MDTVKEIGADRLAYECAKLIEAGHLDTRSGMADALLDYLDIGHPGGAKDVPTWMESYKNQHNV
jgi:hypothetical protein